MTKNHIEFKLEAHIDQEEQQAQTAITSLTTNAWLIFIPPIALFLIAVILAFPFFDFSSIEIIFFVVASVSIFTYSNYAFEIHNINKATIMENPWYLYNQYWFNGLGAFMGWSALYVLLFYRIDTDFFFICN